MNAEDRIKALKLLHDAAEHMTIAEACLLNELDAGVNVRYAIERLSEIVKINDEARERAEGSV